MADTFTKRIVANTDDGYKVVGGSWWDISTWGEGGTAIGCLRFTNVTVPNGATIVSAKLTVKNDGIGDSNANQTEIYGIDEDNTGTFSSDPTGRSSTTNHINWTKNSVSIDEVVDTPDIKTVVQEIVDRGGWASGNAMGFFLKPGSGNNRFWLAYNSDTSNCALLTIVYEGAIAVAEDREIHVRGVEVSTAVLKISKDGISAQGTNDPRDLIFSSQYSTLKYFITGDLEFTIDVDPGLDTVGQASYSHNLGYIPYVEVYMLNPLGKWEYCPTVNGGASTSWHAYVVVTSTQLKVYVGTAGFTSDVTFKFKFFIYKNDLKLT